MYLHLRWLDRWTEDTARAALKAAKDWDLG